MTASIASLAAVVMLGACKDPTGPNDLRVGDWGGEHVGLFVESSRTSFFFDCASGAVQGSISLGSGGSFDVTGTYTPGGNAVGVDHTPRAARYTGHATRTSVTFTRHLVDGSLPDATFTATYGAAPQIAAC